MTIKTKLIGVALMVVTALILIAGLGIVGNSIQARYEHASEASLASMTNLLQARRAEKNFFIRQQDKYSAQLSQCTEKVRQNLTDFAALDEEAAGTAQQGVDIVNEYEKRFKQVASLMREIGFNDSSGIRGQLKDAGDGMTATLKDLYDDKLNSGMLIIRQSVRNYMLTQNQQAREHFVRAYDTFKGKLMFSAIDNKVRKSLTDQLANYSSLFDVYIRKSGELTELRSAFIMTARQLDPIFTELEEHATVKAESVESRVSYITLAAEGVTAIVLLFMIIAVIRSIVTALARLQGYARQVAEGDFSEIETTGITGELLKLHSDIQAMVSELKNKLGFAQGVLKAIPVPCLVSDHEDVVTYTNKEMVGYVGRQGAPEDFTGWKQSRFVFDNDARTLSEQALESGENVDVEFEFSNLAGRELVANITATPIRDLDDNLIGAFLLCLDQTELVQRQKMIQSKNEVIEKAAAEAENISSDVASAAEQLSTQVEQSSHGAELQKQRTSEVATAVEEMNATVLEVARNASNAAEHADKAREVATGGADVVRNVVSSIEGVRSSAGQMKSNLDQLGEQVEGIGQVVDVISDIADQTNLLALNAAIEAARAGDAGRGFAVVADEVRKLAEKTMTATREVGTSIHSIQDGTRRNISNMDDAAAMVQQTSELAIEAGESLNEIVGIVQQTADQIRDIATASEEQSATSEQIARSTEEINLTSEETSEAMNQSAEAVGNVAHLASDLRGVIEKMMQ